MGEEIILTYKDLSGIIDEVIEFYNTEFRDSKNFTSKITLSSVSAENMPLQVKKDLKKGIEEILNKQIEFYKNVYPKSDVCNRFENMEAAAVDYLDDLIEAKLEVENNDRFVNKFQKYGGRYVLPTVIPYAIATLAPAMCTLLSTGEKPSIESILYVGLFFGTVLALFPWMITGQTIDIDVHKPLTAAYNRAYKGLIDSFEQNRIVHS